MPETVLFDLSVLRTAARVRGIGRYVADLATGLSRTSDSGPSLRLSYIERLAWDGAAAVSDDAGAALQRLAAAPRENHLAWAYRLRLWLSRVARERSVDLVHTGHPNATPLGKFSCPRITTCHDLIPLHFPERYLDWRDGYGPGRQWLDYRRYHSADHVIAVSESSANDLVTLLGVEARRISVVYNGVDLERWSPEPEASDVAVRERHALRERGYVIYVGAADWRKNSDGMLKALAQLHRRRPSSELSLAWAAELDEASMTRVRRQAEDLGLAACLKFLGYVSDAELCALYRSALASLFVSRCEGFGYPVLEAMAAGCPVVTSDRSSMAEIAGDAALQADPENADAIADAIAALESDAAAQRRVSANGVARSKRFSLEQMASQTRQVYAQVLRSANSSTLGA